MKPSIYFTTPCDYTFVTDNRLRDVIWPITSVKNIACRIKRLANSRATKDDFEYNFAAPHYFYYRYH